VPVLVLTYLMHLCSSGYLSCGCAIRNMSEGSSRLRRTSWTRLRRRGGRRNTSQSSVSL